MLLVLCTGLLVTGCGSNKLQTRGRVLKNSQPFVLPESEYVRLTFCPVVEGGRARDYYVAEFNRGDATFQVAGKDLQGMPPGKYKIMVEHLRSRNDLFKGAYSEERTPFVCEVHNASDEVTIDLDQKSLPAVNNPTEQFSRRERR
jgi:hypothetical protein